jgi:exopolysaccharide production protein ExoZ
MSGGGRPRLILPIQYLRGVAALMVVWVHALEQVPAVQRWFDWKGGASGVDLFFVISGFIMVVTTQGTDVTPAGFLRRRIVRIVPMYWLLTLTMVALALAAPSLFKTLRVSAVPLVESLLFIPHWSRSFPDQVWPLLVPGWTLNFEMFFYAVFALTLALPERVRTWTFSLVFVLLVAAGVAFGPFSSAVARIYTSPLLLEFLAGTLLAHHWLRGGRALPFAFALLAIVAGGTLLFLRGRPGFDVPSQIVGAILVVWGALHPRLASVESPALRALGDASYSIYLAHLFALGALRVVWRRLASDDPGFAGAAVFMVLAIVVSTVSGYAVYRWIETPLSRAFHRRKPPPPVRTADLAS